MIEANFVWFKLSSVSGSIFLRLEKPRGNGTKHTTDVAKHADVATTSQYSSAFGLTQSVAMILVSRAANKQSTRFAHSKYLWPEELLFVWLSLLPVNLRQLFHRRQIVNHFRFDDLFLFIGLLQNIVSLRLEWSDVITELSLKLIKAENSPNRHRR